jgi:hypothetical protein
MSHGHVVAQSLQAPPDAASDVLATDQAGGLGFAEHRVRCSGFSQREAATIASVTTSADVSIAMEALQRPAAAVPEVLQSPELLPATPGFYGWWSRRGALASVPHIAHPTHEDICLMYVGISPARETSRQTISGW